LPSKTESAPEHPYQLWLTTTIQRDQIPFRWRGGFQWRRKTRSGRHIGLQSAGSAANYSLSIAPVAGFNGNISVTCTGNPATTTCTATPTSVRLSGTTPITAVTIHVSTLAPTKAVLLPFGNLPSYRSPLAACGLAMGVLLLVLLLSAGERKGRYVAVRLALAFRAIGIVSGAASCGGGSGGGGNGGGGIVTLGTSMGTYNLTVTATSGSGTSAIQHSVALTLTVN
jgi:hypothetical protein